MADEALTNLTLSEAAEAIASKKASSLEMTEACLARIERHGDSLNAIAGIDPEAALSAARAADEELARAGPRGPLHGVPLAHKDMFYRAGRVSACGSRILQDYVPDHTATVLSRLDAAGALDIARLNMVEFAFGTTGHNEITGAVHNPWNREHITGGSSSGSGASVAARLVFGALGSDTGGSVRLPAAACGLIGLKTTTGRVSRYGAMPLSFSLDTIGPLVRSVADAALLLAVIAGQDDNDPTSSHRAVPDYTAGLDRGVKGLRIGLPENYFYDPVEPEVASLVRASLGVFEALGAELVPVTLPASVEASNALSMMLIGIEGASFHARWLRERREDYGAQTLGRLLPGLLYPATRYIEALKLRGKLLDDLRASVFDRVDVIHTPMWPFPLPTIAGSDVAANPGFLEFLADTGHCARPVNFAGLPGVVVPAGFTENGLPTAFQLIGRPFDEGLLLAAAAAYERETGCTAQAPPL